MTFLEATKVLAALQNAEKLPFMMATSGTPNQLKLYLRAHAARSGFDAQVSVLSFGTLAQHLFSQPNGTELFLMLPWDLAPECDWRSGMSDSLADVDLILTRAEKIAVAMAERKARWAYLAAPFPPVCAASADNIRLGAELITLAVKYGAVIIPAQRFSITSYLASGAPVAGDALSAVAKVLIDLLLAPPSGTFKVVATDADNTLWAGLVGEDGVNAIAAEPQGRGFRHFVYQSFLLRLKAAGILLAVISRNDEDMVRAPLESGSMPLKIEDFVSIRAGYEAKSDYVRELAESMNLSADSIVFIDDNPVELAEVALAIPGITCQAFPVKDDDLPAFLDRLALLFDRSSVTSEDAERTEMYRRRMATQPAAEGAGLTNFLKDLDMVLTLRDRTNADWTRAHQLINKTNQFNLNGHRLDESQIATVLTEGGRIFTAVLDDRAGSHGEIIACLIDRYARVRALVMSCRVFQRRVEYAFLLWLLNHWQVPTLSFAFTATERNQPLRNFLADPAFTNDGEYWTLDGTAFIATHATDLSLFTIREANCD